MLVTLRIKNYALLRDVEVSFGPGLNVLTGETGAGKSIVIGALNIAAGERGYTESIRTGEEKAVIEAVFDLSNSAELKKQLKPLLEEAGIEDCGDSLIIKRELNRAAKGRIWVNNSPASLAALEKIGKRIIDIHGQHEHQSLLRSEIHMDLLDSYAGTWRLREKAGEIYSGASALNSEIEGLKALEAEKAARLDLINYRIKEIEEAGFSDDSEFESLMAERRLAVNAGAVRDSVNSVITSLLPSALDLEGDGAIDLLERAKKHAAEIAKLDSRAGENLIQMLEDASIKAAEVKDFFSDYKDRINFDPESLSRIESRIEMMEAMFKKYGKKDIAAVKAYYSELSEEKKKIESNERLIAEKQEQLSAMLADLSAVCAELSEKREKKAVELGRGIESELKGLGIAKASFKAEVRKRQEGPGINAEISGKRYGAGPDGIDNVEFMISLNPGEELKPLVKVASGGEISRIMLAIKNILLSADLIPVLVFDEIDTGISGKIAQDVGLKLHHISRLKQVICITHLPQIAAYSDSHYSVGKSTDGNRTETSISRLDDEGKRVEVAKLLSGDRVTEASLKAAGELISATGKKT